MKLLITGATGLIGSEIIKLSLRKNDTVNYLTTARSKIKHTDHIHGFYWDPQSGEIDMECFEGVDAIINLAGVSVAKRWTKAYKKEILQSRISALELLDRSIEKLGKYHIKSIVTASAIGAYPDSFMAYYEEGTSETASDFLGNVVAQWEQAADQLKKHNIPIAKIRTGIVLSTAGGALPPMVKAIRRLVGSSVRYGIPWQSWIHINDIARLFLFAAEHHLTGVYNGVAPNPVSHGKLVRAIASRLKKPLILPPVHEKILKLIFGEMAYIIYASQRVSSEKIASEGFVFNFKSINPALEDLL